MVKFCTKCGASNPPDARFCAKCGVVMSKPVRSRTIFEPAAGVKEGGKPARNRRFMIGAIGMLLMIGGLYFWLFVADDMGSASGGHSGNGVEAGEPAKAKQMFAVTEANIRNKPATVGSLILGKIPRGNMVSGVVQPGADGASEWLELSGGKGFVAAVNLSATEPPEITQALNDRIWVADSALDIWAQPDIASALLDHVGKGSKLMLSGLTANDFIEVDLHTGGVGYIADGAAVLARLGGKPIAISFNPQTCAFGGELGAEFARIGTRLRSQWQALEDKEFADDAARDKAYAAAEGKSAYVKLPRSFEGLSLTAIAQHYESQSLYFSDAPTKVREVFRRKGFRIASDGTFPSTELFAGISATRGEGAAYGKTELGCGV